MKDSYSPVFSHYGLCEVETYFFPPKVKMHSCFKKKKKAKKNYLFLNYVQNNSG